jgi:hypothetical protein
VTVRSFAIVAGGLVFCAFLLIGCGSANPGLGNIHDRQKELETLDSRGAAFEAGRSPASEAEALAADYHNLLLEARRQQPKGVKGDAALVWRSFIGVLDLRAQQATSSLARRVRAISLTLTATSRRWMTRRVRSTTISTMRLPRFGETSRRPTSPR